MSEDLIRRSDAIKALRKLGHEVVVIDKVCSLGVAQEFINVIRELPSADIPQGEWILSDLQSQTDNENGNYAYVCTNCNHTDIHAKTQKVPYCWWCGARMKGADDE